MILRRVLGYGSFQLFGLRIFILIWCTVFCGTDSGNDKIFTGQEIHSLAQLYPRLINTVTPFHCWKMTLYSAKHFHTKLKKNYFIHLNMLYGSCKPYTIQCRLLNISSKILFLSNLLYLKKYVNTCNDSYQKSFY